MHVYDFIIYRKGHSLTIFGFGMGGINASVFPSIALAVPSNMTTLAFAGVGAMLNASMVFFPYFADTIFV